MGHDGIRRGLLKAAAGLPLLSLTRCALPNSGASTGAGLPIRRLIDAHCHIFNVTDLPAASFIQQVFLKDYPDAIEPTVPEGVLRASLDEIQRILAIGVTEAEDEAAIGLTDEASQSTPELSNAEKAAMERELRRIEAQSTASSDLLACGHSAAISLRSATTWLMSLRSRRTRLASQLRKAHRKSGFTTALLAPALVDYSNWLGQELQSPLPDQVGALGRVAQNTQLPPVHGYVAFDPLRRALIREKLPTVDGSWDPLALIRDALTEEGFVGVKLYPPMGFRPSGNAGASQSYQPAITARFGTADGVGRALDQSLDELWDLCNELDAPIMAHAADSNNAGRGYGLRADPSYWFPVAQKHPGLRILMGHFGRFRSVAAETGKSPACNDDVAFEDTWEAAIGRYVRDHPDCGLFADISYLSEVFRADDRARCIDRLRRYRIFDGDARHLIFGSDWVMLGIEKEYRRHGGYPAQVADLLADAGLSDTAIDGVMYGNAIRFLGLGPGSRTRERLLAFYAKHGLPVQRLPS